MSPVIEAPNIAMPPSPVFPLHAGYDPENVARAFPPNLAMFKDGIEQYRADKGYASMNRYRGIELVQRFLPDTVFTADGSKWRITDVTVHRIANPIAREDVGHIERSPRTLIPSIAAAIGSYNYMGQGGKHGIDANINKNTGDREATVAMRGEFNRNQHAGKIRGGEGGGRDGQTRRGALFMNEKVGTGAGQKVHYYVDPLEVTNCTRALEWDYLDDPAEYRKLKPKTYAWGNVGRGWAPELTDPAKWYPGYSGASTLMLAINADEGRGRPLSDFLYLDKAQFNYAVWTHLRSQGFSLRSKPEDLVKGVSAALRIPVKHLRAGALARSRHLPTMNGWIKAGIEPWNIHTPSDGDALFAPALAAGSLHFAGLTGGVMEGVVSAALGIPLGIHTQFQFVSHHKLGEKKDQADLTNPEHRFGFSKQEYSQMRLTKLFDSEHVGHALRAGDPSDDIANAVTNMAFSHLAEEEYDAFFERFKVIVGMDVTLSQEERVSFINLLEAKGTREINLDEVQAALETILAKKREGFRFNERERQLIVDALKEEGFLNVRDEQTFSDFVVGTHDWMAAVSAITPNKWAPLQGIRTGPHGSLIVDTLVVTGAHAVYILESKIEKVD